RRRSDSERSEPGSPAAARGSANPTAGSTLSRSTCSSASAGAGLSATPVVVVATATAAGQRGGKRHEGPHARLLPCHHGTPFKWFESLRTTRESGSRDQTIFGPMSRP